MTTYQPELGQAVFGAPTGEHEMPEYAIALFRGVWREMSRIFGNREQRAFDGYGTEDPKLPGFTVRPYRSDETPEAELPNFVFGEVEIRWYKYPGRGMSVNVDWKPDQWVAWFDAAMKALRDYEEAEFAKRYPQKPIDEDDVENPF